LATTSAIVSPEGITARLTHPGIASSRVPETSREVRLSAASWQVSDLDDGRVVDGVQAVGMSDSVRVEDVRVEVYRTFASTGRAPSADALAELLGTESSLVREALHELAAARHLVLDDTDAIVMAHPFASIPLGFSVMGADTLWWGGCAWDSFALPHLIPSQSPVLVATRCPHCDRPLAWNVGTDTPPTGAEVAHFLVPAAHMWDDVVHTCGNQRLFCSADCVDGWLEETENTRGYVMDLTTLWNFAAGWYAGRLDHGYQRREPSLAADYMRAVGLDGPFWGL
jgi:hypothetical protein